MSDLELLLQAQRQANLNRQASLMARLAAMTGNFEKFMDLEHERFLSEYERLNEMDREKPGETGPDTPGPQSDDAG